MMELSDIDNPLTKMRLFMEKKLNENSHKSGWHGSPARIFIRRIQDELGELKRCVDRKESPEEVWREAADVANFAMMVADIYETEYDDD